MDHARQDEQKSGAALSSVLWSALLTAMKFVVGIMTGSLGILSEALHSALDLLSATGTYFAVKVAARPADEDHPYGHGKVENLMALAETLLLLLTAAWVIKEAWERLASDDPAALQVETSVWAFVVIIVSMLVDINRAAMLRRVAKETKSPALEADAAHFSTDIWSSAAVLLGISGAAVASFTLPGSWLEWVFLRMDVFASLVVAFFILTVCKELGGRAIDNLMDKTDGETAATARRVMQERMPAYPVRELRVLETGSKAYLSMVVDVPRDLHVDTAHEIADAIGSLMAEVLPGSETRVHMQPAELDTQQADMLVRQIALTHRFGVHGLVLMHADQGFIIFTDLELPPDATLGAWSVAVQAFKNDLRRRLHADKVIVHVEPNLRELPSFPAPLPPTEEWEECVRRAMAELNAPAPQQIELYTRGAERLCAVFIPRDDTLTVEQSHTMLSTLTKRLTAALPPVARIIVAYAYPRTV